MPRAKADPAEVYRCVEAFAVFDGNVPRVYGFDDEILGDDPILKTHRAHFIPASEAVRRRSGIEQATAAPGEVRSVSFTAEKEDSNG